MIISNAKRMNLTLNDHCFFGGILIYCSKRQFDILDAGNLLRKDTSMEKYVRQAKCITICNTIYHIIESVLCFIVSWFVCFFFFSKMVK